MLVNSFYEEPGAANWYATDTIGLVRKDVKTGATQRFINEPLNNKSLSNNSVIVIRKDRKGFFWVGTRGGLNRFDYNTRSFTPQHFPYI